MHLRLTTQLYSKQVSMMKHVELHWLNHSSRHLNLAIFGRCCTADFLDLHAFYHVHPESLQAALVSGLYIILYFPTRSTWCRAQKMSLWSWALGSVCTVVSECYELLQLSKPPSTGEGKEAWEIKRMKAQAEINTRMITLVHALFQVGGAIHLQSTICLQLATTRR